MTNHVCVLGSALWREQRVADQALPHAADDNKDFTHWFEVNSIH
jgi:hypothetical protein